MKVAFTKSHLPLSKFIMWGLSEDCSHTVIIFDEKLVIHSNLFGVHVNFLESFKKHCTIVHEVELDLPLIAEENVYKNLIQLDGLDYDFKAFLYFCWRGILKMLFKIPLPKLNKFNSSGILCTEIVQCLRNIIDIPEDLSMYSPYMVYKYLESKK